MRSRDVRQCGYNALHTQARNTYVLTESDKVHGLEGQRQTIQRKTVPKW